MFFIVKVATTVCLAAEIDSVTTRNVKLGNSRAAINEIINQRITEGVDRANQRKIKFHVVGDLEFYQEKEYCDEEDLYRELRKAIFDSDAVTWGLKGYHLDKQLRSLLAKKSYSLSLNDSIYRDIGYIEGISLNLKELSDVVNIDGNLVGIDKFGHFFAEGWRYFEMTEFEGKSVYDALAWGKEKESGLFGYRTTGIFSYADLVSNFNGMRFWNRVMLKRDDPLKGVIANLFERSYVTCDIQIIDSIKAGKMVKAWEVNASFDIADYIDGSWDEGNNCNSYDDPVIEKKVAKRIQNVDPAFACPYRQQVCSRARAKYVEFSRYLLHPSCLRTQ
jgi:nucleoside diphosphate kinase